MTKWILVGVSMRDCPKCGSPDFFCDTTTVGESYEVCQECSYIERGALPKRYRKIGNRRFDWENYVEDPCGNYHNHGKYGWHKVEVQHRPVEGEIYSLLSLKEKISPVKK